MTDASPARRGLDALLAAMPHADVESLDTQLPRPLMVYDVNEEGERAAEPYRKWDLPAGPWMLVKLVNGEEYAIWKPTGDVYRVGPDGAVDQDPMLGPHARPT